jgi:hypothetical protein
MITNGKILKFPIFKNNPKRTYSDSMTYGARPSGLIVELIIIRIKKNNHENLGKKSRL